MKCPTVWFVIHHTAAYVTHSTSVFVPGPVGRPTAWRWSRTVCQLERCGVSWATLWVTVTLARRHHSSSFPVKIDVGTWSVMPAHLWTRSSPGWIRAPAIIITKRRKSRWVRTSEAGLLRNNELLAVCESRWEKQRRRFKCKHKADNLIHVWRYVDLRLKKKNVPGFFLIEISITTCQDKRWAPMKEFITFVSNCALSPPLGGHPKLADRSGHSSVTGPSLWVTSFTSQPQTASPVCITHGPSGPEVREDGRT